MARFEHVSGNTGCLYLRGNCIPVYCMSEKEWIIMDSGSRYDREELIRFLGENAIRVKAVLTSHAHYDHVGNHALLRKCMDVNVSCQPLTQGRFGIRWP